MAIYSMHHQEQQDGWRRAGDVLPRGSLRLNGGARLLGGRMGGGSQQCFYTNSSRVGKKRL